jgi:hypothetical protein
MQALASEQAHIVALGARQKLFVGLKIDSPDWPSLRPNCPTCVGRTQHSKARDTCFCHEALAAPVAAPQIAYFPVSFKNGSFWSDQNIRADRTSRHIAHAGPASPRWFGLCVTYQHALPPKLGMNPENRALCRIGKLKFSASKKFLWTTLAHHSRDHAFTSGCIRTWRNV